MKRQHSTLTTGSMFSLVAILILGLSGCASTSETEDEAASSDTGSEFSDAGATAPPPPREEPARTEVAEVVDLSIEPVYFDYDRSELRPDTMSILKSAADQLGDSDGRVVISGHCDSRGSEEYNLALGERRAASVRRYLANLGVPMRQMTIVSYGEIRPAAQGNTEAAWALNRRAEFEVAN